MTYFLLVLYFGSTYAISGLTWYDPLALLTASSAAALNFTSLRMGALFSKVLGRRKRSRNAYDAPSSTTAAAPVLTGTSLAPVSKELEPDQPAAPTARVAAPERSPSPLVAVAPAPVALTTPATPAAPAASAAPAVSAPALPSDPSPASKPMLDEDLKARFGKAVEQFGEDDLRRLLEACPQAVHECPWSTDCGSLLHMAAEAGESTIVTLLLSQGAPSNALDSDKKTALHIAAENGHLGATVALTVRVPCRELGMEDNYKMTPFHLACEDGNKELVAHLLLNYSLLATYYLLLTTHYCLLTTHYSLSATC